MTATTPDLFKTVEAMHSIADAIAEGRHTAAAINWAAVRDELAAVLPYAAANPDLLAACEGLLAAIDTARAAIAKATGRTD